LQPKTRSCNCVTTTKLWTRFNWNFLFQNAFHPLLRKFVIIAFMVSPWNLSGCCQSMKSFGYSVYVYPAQFFSFYHRGERGSIPSDWLCVTFLVNEVELLEISLLSVFGFRC
jgi:hypothetical protein